MESLFIRGGRKLSGDIDIVSAKNALLPILAGCVVSDKKIVIHKISEFSDVVNMIKILENLGVKTTKIEDDLFIDASSIANYVIREEFTNKVRSSIFLLGPLLTRFRRAKVAYPGGCNIGNRPIDQHIKGLKILGVKIEEKHGFIICDGSHMKSGAVHLDFPSVGATENLMMASIMLKGTTTIQNAAMEPEIEDLQSFLNSMGCKINGAGTSTITIVGVETLKETEFTPIADRIIAGTYMIAAAMCGGNIKLNNVNKIHNESLIEKLKNAGVAIEDTKYGLEISSSGNNNAISIIETQPYPGFPTDMQNQLLAMQTISQGTSIVIENLFENRFKICGELIKMGADITIKDRMAVVQGVKQLSGAQVKAYDLRCGAGLVLAGLVADGYTTINDIYHIDRGYLSIEKDFCKLGAEIARLP